MKDLTGIETRTDTQGQDMFRAYVKDCGRKVRGPWTSSYTDARGWRVRAMAKMLDGHLTPPNSITIRTAAGEFLDGARDGIILSRKRSPYAPATLRGYTQAFEDWINPELGDIPVKALKRSQVQRFVDRQSAERSNGTVRNTWAALAALYAYLLPRHDDLINPTQGVMLPRPGSPRERYAEPDEMAELLAALPYDLAFPFALAFYAGLRRAEIQALPIDSIDLNGRWIDVRYALDPSEGFKGPKSGAGERHIPIFAPLAPYVDGSLGGTNLSPVPGTRSTPSRPGTLALPSRRASRFGAQMLGRPYTLRCATFWSKAGLNPIGLHEARHSFATAAIRAGHDVALVSEWLGHAQTSTTLNIYVKARGRAAGLTDRMDSYLAGGTPWDPSIPR